MRVAVVSNRIGATLLLVCLILGDEAQADEWLTIELSQHSQTRSVLFWIKHYFSELKIAAESDVPGIVRDNERISLIPLGQMLDPPYASIGKLMFRRSDQGGHHGSCTAFSGGATSTVITAAHCVMDFSGEWHRDFVFISHFGSVEAKIHSVKCIAIPTAWGGIGDYGSLAHDYAVLKIAPDAKGFLAFDFIATPKVVEIVGYTGSAHDRMVRLEQGEGFFEDSVSHFSALQNPMGPGSSGSPWLAVGSGLVLSLSSRYEGAASLHLNGPKLDTSFQRMQRFVQYDCEAQ